MAHIKFRARYFRILKVSTKTASVPLNSTCTDFGIPSKQSKEQTLNLEPLCSGLGWQSCGLAASQKALAQVRGECVGCNQDSDTYISIQMPMYTLDMCSMYLCMYEYLHLLFNVLAYFHVANIYIYIYTYV